MMEGLTSTPVLREVGLPAAIRSAAVEPFGADSSDGRFQVVLPGRYECANVSGVVEIRLETLALAGSPRILGENVEHIRALAEVDAVLPPILIHKKTMRVIDGIHRVKAAVLRGATTIRAQLFDGTDHEAFVLSVRMNNSHGLPLSLSDRRAAAARILAQFPEWSDRAIAATVGLAHGTVGRIRLSSTDQDGQSNIRMGRDGRTRSLSADDGRRRVGELIADMPEAPIRELAKAAGVSVGTAHDVRQRIRRGEEPVPRRHTDVAKATKKKPCGPQTANEPKDPTVLIQGLRTDPSLRFTEPGRALLRRLAAHPTEQEWDALAVGVPDHCTKTVAQLAGTIANDWLKFAERLNQL
ncbi:ParB N-terminal domain-containing protein [Nocardia sp. NPDC049149]|uniref:ParB/RepB/Spo0J family partition protein n=1 Tax=Nocardia sp. NPDC049149 TaxID=3364315 RepID=UPI0037149636